MSNLKPRGSVNSEASLEPDSLRVDVDEPFGVVVAKVFGHVFLAQKQQAAAVIGQLRK